MIVQEDIPYTKEEIKAMVKTIHDLREKVSLSCSIGAKIDTNDACMLVCWDFELNKELMVE